MTDNLPDYARLEPPADAPPEEYTTHERRAEILQLLINSGSPTTMKQRRLADRYDVHESTISRDMDRLRESVDDGLGEGAKLTTRTIFEKTVRELQDEGEWKAAWDVVMDWNEWLADLGEQHREPRRSELAVDMERRNVDVAYEVVRGEDGDPLLASESGPVDTAEISEPDVQDSDTDDLGFAATPATIELEDRGDQDDEH